MTWPKDKSPYENPAVFEASDKKEKPELGEELRRGIMREKGKWPWWLKKYFFLILAGIVLIVFAVAIIFFKQ